MAYIFRYSILPAILLDGVLHLNIQDCSYTSTTFNEFIEGLLDNINPFPQKNSVIVMDNASIHKLVYLEEMIWQRYIIPLSLLGSAIDLS